MKKGGILDFSMKALFLIFFLFHIMFEFDILKFFVLRNSFIQEINYRMRNSIYIIFFSLHPIREMMSKYGMCVI